MKCGGKFLKPAPSGPHCAATLILNDKHTVHLRTPASGDTEMKTRNRFIKSVVATAAASDTTMPWTRSKARVVPLKPSADVIPFQLKSA